MMAFKRGFFFSSSSINIYFLLWKSYVSLLRDLLIGLRSYLLPWAAKHYLTRNLWFLCCCCCCYCCFFFFTLVLIFKAKQCGTSQIDEDGVFELVRTKPGNETSYEPPIVEKKEKISVKVICHNWVKDLCHLQQHKQYHHHLHWKVGVTNLSNN